MNKLKDFYLKNMFDGYVENMPNWLKECAEKEILQFLKVIFKKAAGQKVKIFDIGCGDCRIYKEVMKMASFGPKNLEIEYACSDIFSKEELPQDFKDWLKENKINYIPLKKKKENLYECDLSLMWCNYYDIVTSFGIDDHCSVNQLKTYFQNAEKMLNKNGILVWKKLRTDTWQGMRINEENYHLCYETNNLSNYYEWSSLYLNDLSYIIEYDINLLKRKNK